MEVDPKLEKRLETLRDDHALQDMAAIFQALSDPTRLEILMALDYGPLCVDDLSRLTDKSPSAVSHQLRILRNLRLVRYTKDGRRSIYQLDDDHVHGLIHQALEHVSHEDH